MHHTKEKGDLGVFHVMLDLAEQGYTILSPLTEHAPFDLVIYEDNMTFTRIQVKYRAAYNGAIRLSFRNSWADKNGNHANPLDKDSVDIIAIYCPDTRKCYYFNPSHFGKAISLRIEPTANNQSKGVHFADDYTKLTV